MKAQEKIKNDEINLKADILTDLPVADKQADETRGGRGGQAGDLADWRSNYGVSI